MKKIDFGQAFNTLANLAVLAGLIFVGLQLMQDREMNRNAVLTANAETAISWAEAVGQNEHVWMKGLAGEPLTIGETERFNALATAFEAWHQTRFAFTGSLDIVDPNRFSREWALQLFSHPGLLNWWRRYRQISDRYTNPNASAWRELIELELDRLESGEVRID